VDQPFPFWKGAQMLAISPAATSAIDAALEAVTVPEGAGLRLASGPPTERGVAIEIAFVTAADPGDQVIETAAAADVFVEPQTAQLLDDQVLDASLEPDGSLNFTLHPQGPSMDGAGPGA
jgi:Fe-S cluster assembly iron-binding protein IscA